MGKALANESGITTLGLKPD